MKIWSKGLASQLDAQNRAGLSQWYRVKMSRWLDDISAIFSQENCDWFLREADKYNLALIVRMLLHDQ